MPGQLEGDRGGAPRELGHAAQVGAVHQALCPVAEDAPQLEVVERELGDSTVLTLT